MGREEEFSEYAAGRWRLLVRSAVLLGCDVGEAEDLARATLLRCYVKWTAVSRAEHRDAYVARIMLNLHHQSRRRRWWGERPTSDDLRERFLRPARRPPGPLAVGPGRDRTYTVTATAPGYDDGHSTCRAEGPVVVRDHRTTHVRVYCQED